MIYVQLCSGARFARVAKIGHYGTCNQGQINVLFFKICSLYVFSLSSRNFICPCSRCFSSVCAVRGMSAARLVRLVRCSGPHVSHTSLVQRPVGPSLAGCYPLCTVFRRSLYSPSESRHSNTRFDADSSGRPTTWDSFGIWDNRIDEPILLPPSIRYGKPIPKVSLSKVGCASLIGGRKENEDRFQVSQMTDRILYFAVFDGHGGPEAADFCEKHMERFIK